MQQTEPVNEETKADPSAPMTPLLMELKINTEVANSNLNLSNLEKRALALVKNEDSLKDMAVLIEDLDKIEDIADETFKAAKKPYSDAAKACDDGKKLFLENLSRIRGMVEPDYAKLLEAVQERKRLAAIKEVQDKAIKKGIEDTVAGFAQRIASAGTREELTAIERLINLEKGPSRTKKYGDFHELAIKRYDEELIPIIQRQKTKLGRLKMLNGALEEAKSDSEVEEVNKLEQEIGTISQDIRQNQAAAEDILTQEFSPVEEVQEVLPEVRTKRTDISFELADVVVALKKVPELLEIDLNKKEVRKVAKKLKKDGAFEGKKELIVDGIKYTVTRKMEAL
jgi:hypothetical protein